VELQSVAATAFTALVDALWISLFALRPGNGLPTTSLVLGLVGLTSAIGLTVRLWRARTTQELTRRWPFLLGVIAGLYAYQVSTAFTARAAASPVHGGNPGVHLFRGSAGYVPGNCLACAAAGRSTCWSSRLAGRRPPGGTGIAAPGRGRTPVRDGPRRREAGRFAVRHQRVMARILPCQRAKVPNAA